MTDASTPTVRYWRCERFPFSIVWAAPYHADLAAELDADSRWTEVVVLTPAELAAIKAEVRAEGREDAARAVESVPHPDRCL